MQNRAILSKLLFLDPAITYATMKDSTHGHGRGLINFDTNIFLN